MRRFLCAVGAVWALGLAVAGPVAAYAGQGTPAGSVRLSSDDSKGGFGG